MKTAPKMTRSDLLELANMIDDKDALIKRLNEIGNDSTKGDWAKYARKLLKFVITGKPEFSVFRADGNIKIPFVSFSVLPLVTCPGAGECKTFCYSLRSLRYPSTFFRQLQNTLIIKNNPELIKTDMDRILRMRKFKAAIALGKKIDMRLYVDGDIDSMQTMDFWMQDFLPSFPMLQTYGYSKSFDLFLDYHKAGKAFPSNYVLNLSSGSIYDNTQLVEEMEKLAVTRNKFIAVKIESKIKFSAPKGDYKTPAYKAAVRDAIDYKAFVCPGQCGSCTGAGHACGNPNVNVPIVIGIH